MSNLNLQEAIDLIKNSKGDISSLLKSEDLWGFARQIDESTVEILKDKEDEYVMGMLALMESLATTILILQGKDPVKVLMLIEDDMVSNYGALIMKFTIGLCAMEELR
jgi:hypothetical protein